MGIPQALKLIEGPIDALARLPQQSLVAMAQRSPSLLKVLPIVLNEKADEAQRAANMAALAQGTPPSVTEQNMAINAQAEAQPMMAAAQPMMLPENVGVAALPVPEGSYAGGGIVAFDDGGEVQRFQGQGPSLVQSSPAARMIPRGFTFFDLQNIGPTIKSGFESMFPPEELEAVRLRDQIRSALGGKGGPYGMFKVQTDAEFAENKALAQRLNIMPLDELRQVAERLKTKPAAVNFDRDFKDTDIGVSTTQPAPAAGGSDLARPNMFGLASIPSFAKPNYSLLKSEAENIAGEFAGTTPNVPTNADATRKALDIYAAANVDFDLFKKQAEALTKEKANIKLDKREAGSIRLIEAGLGILGGESPHAFVNIGKGASPALKGLAEDLKDIKKLDRERDKEIRNLQVAENQLRAGVGKDAFDIINRAEQRLDTFNREDRQLRASIFNNLISSETTRAVAEFNAKAQLARPSDEQLRQDMFRKDPEAFKRYQESMRPGFETAQTQRDKAILEQITNTLLTMKKDDPQRKVLEERRQQIINRMSGQLPPLPANVQAVFQRLGIATE